MNSIIPNTSFENLVKELNEKDTDLPIIRDVKNFERYNNNSCYVGQSLVKDDY